MVCAIGAFIWGFNFLRGSNLFTHKYYLYALYPKIDNLIEANPVLLNGYKIGQINKISLVKHGKDMMILVKFILTEDINIPKNSIARAVSSDILGTKAVEIVFSPNLEFVKSGDTLRTEMEQGFKEEISKRLAPIQAKAESLIGSMDSVMTIVSLVLNTKTRDNIDKSFESVRRAILSLESTTYKLDDLMGSEKTKMSSILSNLNNVTGNLSRNEQKINNILNNVSTLSDSLAKANLKTAVENAGQAVKQLNVLLSHINEGQGTLGKLAKNDSLYNNLNRSAEDLDKLLSDLRLNPGRYVHISVFGKKDKNKPKK